VQAALAAELRMERDDGDVALARGDRMAVDLGEDFDAGAVLLDPRRPDEHRVHGLVEVGEVEVGLERADLAAERVAPGLDVHQPQMVAVEHDQAGARAQHRRAGAHELPERLGQALGGDAQRHRRRLAAGQHEAVEAVEGGGRPHLAHVGAEVAQHPQVRVEAALQRQDADQRHVLQARAAYQPRLARTCDSSSLRASSDCIAAPSPVDAAATRSASLKWRAASTTARAIFSGLEDLKMPEPTKTDSAPSCIISDASAGVAMPPALNSGTGSLPFCATARTTS